MDSLRELPGYKTVLKAVLKSQIQHLVEQLAAQTDEEALILTACVSDGTLSHFGSDSGKSFLTDHDEVKAQFMGFCLKKHHNAGRQSALEQQLKAPLTTNLPVILPKPAANLPQAIIPLTLAPLIPISQSKPSGVRHEPYPHTRRGRKSSQNVDNSAGKTTTVESQVHVPSIPVENSEMADESSSSIPDQQLTSPVQDPVTLFSTSTPMKAEKNDLINSQASIDEESPMTQLEADGMTVKIEKNEEDDLDFAVSSSMEGLDPERSTSFDASADSMNMTGGQSDLMSGIPELQCVGVGDQPVKVHVCNHCGKPFPSKWELSRHRRIHTGEKPYKCEFCSKAFSDKSNMTQHVRGVHFKQPYRKDRDTNRDKESPENK